MNAVVAGLIVETLPGAAPRVAARLVCLEGMSVEGGDGDRRLAAVWSAGSGGRLGEMAERLLAGDPEVLGIFPTFVGREDGEPGEP